MKRFLTIAVTAFLCCSLAVPCFAAGAKPAVEVMWTDFSMNSVGGVSPQIWYRSNSDKPIKYIEWHLTAYNAVGDPVKCDIRNRSSIIAETVGPIYKTVLHSSSTTPYTKTYCADDDPFKTSYYTGYYINTTNPALYHNGSDLKYTIDMDSFGNYYASGRNLDETFLSADEIANAVYKDYSYFEICWYNFTIADFRVTKAEVIFMDGSKTVVSGNSVYSPYFKHDLDNKPFTTQVNQYSDVYNYKDYLNYNPDLNEALGNNQRALFEHFINFGMKEGRQGSSKFNLDIYKANNPDLVALFGDDNVRYYEHFISSGKAEGRIAVSFKAPNTVRNAKGLSETLS